MKIITSHDTAFDICGWSAEVHISKHVITGTGRTEADAIEKLQHHLRNHITLLGEASKELEIRMEKTKGLT